MCSPGKPLRVDKCNSRIRLAGYPSFEPSETSCFLFSSTNMSDDQVHMFIRRLAAYHARWSPLIIGEDNDALSGYVVLEKGEPHCYGWSLKFEDDRVLVSPHQGFEQTLRDGFTEEINALLCCMRNFKDRRAASNSVWKYTLPCGRWTGAVIPVWRLQLGVALLQNGGVKTTFEMLFKPFGVLHVGASCLRQSSCNSVLVFGASVFAACIAFRNHA
eukprot:s373_g36.t1